jgi:hypothetical protein
MTTAILLCGFTQWSTQVRGADTNWTANSAADFLWSNAANWSLGAPTSEDNVFFLTPIPNPGTLPNPSVIALGGRLTGEQSLLR